ncbi:MAG: helix-turn-helix transcriptional regulator [Bacilli bacterium]|nr:helix-turn-helix transcriptional regulator [Bacilli bacterium]
MDKFKFGEYIYQKRKKLNLTQDELGRKLGVTNKAVSKWEVGETLPDVSMLAPLAKVLEVSVDELLNYTDKTVNDQSSKPKFNLIMLISLIVLTVAEIITIILLIISYNKEVPSIKSVCVTNDNIKEIVDINPSSQVVCDEEVLKIDSTFKLNNGYELIEGESVSFTIVYQYEYYYYLKDGSIGMVTYYNRFYDVVLDFDNPEALVSVHLEPKFNIEDFKGFNQVKISYIVLDAQGTINKDYSN